MKIANITQFTRHAEYRVNIGWDYLESWLDDQVNDKRVGGGLDLDPDFQRAHVWSRTQQVNYVEYALRGGTSGRDLYFNCAGWMNSFAGPYVIVDGKQRLQAVRLFLADKIPAFGAKRSEYTDRMRLNSPDFVWHVNDLKTRAEYLRWYLEMNTGGTPHTRAELDRVGSLLLAEMGQK